MKQQIWNGGLGGEGMGWVGTWEADERASRVW